MEVSHISNPDGEALLSKDAVLRKIGEAIGKGIAAYAGERKKSWAKTPKP